MHIIPERQWTTSDAACSRSRRVIAVGLVIAGLTTASFTTVDAAPAELDHAHVSAPTTESHPDHREKIRSLIALLRVRAATAQSNGSRRRNGLVISSATSSRSCSISASPTRPMARWATTGSTTRRSTTSSSTALRPEALVYEPGPNGQLRLVAVEWIVPVAAWEAAGNTEPPSVLGQKMHVLNPALGWYVLHAWVWKYNPSGVFEDWNPNVVCP